MDISLNDWIKYRDKLSSLNTAAYEDMLKWVQSRGGYENIPRQELIEYAYAVSTKYGEASASLSAEMYDTVARLSKVTVPAAEVADTAEIEEVAKAINGTIKKPTTNEAVSSVPARYAKRAGADTTLKNAKRDGAQFAWIPAGETCAFCLALASNGWQYASADTIKGDHAEHIHNNCDCTFAIRFDEETTVKGYNPEVYRDMYYSAEGNTPEEKINSMRRMQYKHNKDKINAQKRANYAEKRENALYQHKKGDKVNITSQSINKVKAIGPSSYTTEEVKIMQLMNKEILRISQEQNDSNEVAMAMVNGVISKPVFGIQGSVNVYADPDMFHILKGSDAVMRSVTLSHNHPGLSYFSIHDLGIFTECPSIKTMEVVTNNGKTWYISKKENYDDLQVMQIYKKVIEENKNDAEKAVDSFIKRIYNMIERN